MDSAFVWFSANFSDCKFEERLGAGDSKEKMISFLHGARAVCWNKMFDCAPIEKAGIEKLAASFGKPKSVGELASILSSIKPGALEAQLRAFVKAAPSKGEAADLALAKKQKADPVEFAFSYFLFCMWKSVFPQSIAFQQRGLPSKKEVRFAANLPGWVVVKKVDLEKAEPKEVLFALSGIFPSVNNKLSQTACSNPDGFDNFVSSFLNSFPVRKSFAKLSALLNEALAKEQTIAQFASDKTDSEILRQSFFLSCFQHAGFMPFVSLETIAGVYPDLKIPKPRGNFGGKKKK